MMRKINSISESYRLRVVQVIVIVVCYQGQVSGEVKQGCVGSQLSLICPRMEVIQITSVVLGDTYCYGKSCCIKDNDCTHNANANHRDDVHRRCDNKHGCTVGVIQEKINCGFFTWSNSDFERITYNCIQDPRNDTINETSYEESTVDNNDTYFIPVIIAHGCVGTNLSLNCGEMKVIEVIDVILGDSLSTGTTCEIEDNNCTRNANANHTKDVRDKCNGQSNCTVDVLEEQINCGTSGLSSHNDFELIAYNCLDDSQNNVTSTDRTVTITNVSNNMSTEAGPTTDMVTIGIVIICILVLLAIILVAVVMYRRKKRTQTKTRLDPVAMTEVDNGQNVYDVCADETQGTSLHGDCYAQSLYSQIEESDSPKRGENPIIYSEVELRGAIWKDGETTGKTKAAAVESSTQPQTGTVSKPSSPQDDGCQMVIENDLYGMADNYAKDTAVESPIRSLAGADSKNPSPQDDEGLTVIENDIYCH